MPEPVDSLRGFGNRDEQVMAVAISPDGTRIAAGTGLPNGQGAAHVWNAQTGALLWSTADSAKEVLVDRLFAGRTVARGRVG